MSCSIVKYYGKQSGRCGYCRKTSSKDSGMHAYIMTPQDYQDLIDRGWRRSGQYCYKPANKTTCCTSYTIRCDSQQFTLSKSHKKVLKRMNKFLLDGIKEKTDSGQTTSNLEEGKNLPETTINVNESPEIPDIAIKNIDVSKIVKATESCIDVRQSKTKNQDDEVSTSDIQKESKKSTGLEQTKPVCKKAKQIRLERKQAKYTEKGLSLPENKKRTKNVERTLKDFIDETPKDGRHKLKIEIVEVNSKGFFQTLNESFTLYKKYQEIIHNDPPENIEDFLLFLQNSPLELTKTSAGPPEGYGSFHQQYWLDNRLIAVGVIDILPYCVSSVYFFYDPEYSFLSLGTYGSLREVDFTRRLSENCPSLKYYYMGFYIHSCPKMIYKGRLNPSYLLCPEVYSWHLLTDDIRKKLDQSKYQRLNEDINAYDINKFTANDLNSVLILHNNSYTTYRNFKQNANCYVVDEDEIIEYGEIVGKACTQKMLYVLD